VTRRAGRWRRAYHSPGEQPHEIPCDSRRQLATAVDEQTLKPAVLIVDDTPSVAELISRWLSQDYQVHIANSGLDAIKMAEAISPSIAVIDILMARPNGFEIAETLRAHTKFARLPIVFMTGLPRPENALRASQTGAIAVLQKPLDRQLLLTTLERALRV
jgi:CheY-like chemotaxis protein